MNREKELQTRSLQTKLKTRAEEDEMIIEGYFAVYNTNRIMDRGI